MRVMGGIFGLEDAAPPRGGTSVLEDGDLLLVNARSGLFVLAQHLRPSRVWLPAFLCESMIQAVLRLGTALSFYPIDEAFSPSLMGWLDRVRRGDLVVVVDYFGFVPDEEAASRIRERGAWILEDATQALLSRKAGSLGDFVILSPRKFAGLPDGGILRTRTATSPAVRLEAPPPDWWRITHAACAQRQEFDRNGGERRWLDLSQTAEKDQPLGAYAMSDLALRIARSVDWDFVARKRIDNYRVLAERLTAHAVFPHLDDGTVPLGFTVRIRNRDAVRACLFANEIYPSWLWPLDGRVPREFALSHRLSAEVMTLHCDQRLDEEDMVRTADLVLSRAEG